MNTRMIPRAFFWKRIHSLMGLWLVLFLLEHLLTNSQAAFWLGDQGSGFVRMVNALHNLPYLHVIEWTLLGIPIAIHMGWGIHYALQSKGNAHKTDGNSPSLPKLGRNRAYSWQRITSWILVILLTAHIVKFRFLEYPETVSTLHGTVYLARVEQDPKLSFLSARLGVRLYDTKAIMQEKRKLEQKARTITKKQTVEEAQESYQIQEQFVKALSSISLKPSERIMESSDFGSITLLKVRETFQNPMYCVVYTVFVLAACFHAFNGLWTFVLSWGLVIRLATQRRMLLYTISLMILITGLGLMAIWGSK